MIFDIEKKTEKLTSEERADGQTMETTKENEHRRRTKNKNKWTSTEKKKKKNLWPRKYESSHRRGEKSIKGK